MNEESKDPKKVEEKEQIVFRGKYFYGTGRRKTSVARVRIYPQTSQKNIILVNSKDYQDYFVTLELKRIVEDSFRVTGNKGKFSVSVVVSGGGKRGQAEAVRHGIARALTIFQEGLRPVLRDSGFLTRDPRTKERKKPGLKKARRAPQWQKR